MRKTETVTTNAPRKSSLSPPPCKTVLLPGWSCTVAFHFTLIVIIGLLAYANTLHAPFVFDDESSIVDNPVIRDLPNFLSGAGYAYNPRRFIGYLSFALNYKLGGLNVVGYHLVNLAIHSITAWLVYILASLTLRTPFFKDSGPGTEGQGPEKAFTDYRSFLPLLAALLFVAHPIQTQAVTYIVQRLASLATLFYLLSLVCYVSARLGQEEPSIPDSQSPIPGPRSLFFVASLVAALLAMRTKEIAATLPLVVVLYEFSFFGASTRKKLLFLLPLLLTLLIIPLGMLHTGRPLGELLSDVNEMTRDSRLISRGEYLLTQFTVIATYIRLLFLPINQNLDYDYPVYGSFFALPVLGGCILICSFIGLAIYFYYRTRQVSPFTVHRSPFTAVHRLIAFGILWFFITLTVESSIIPISDVIFEHRLYLPAVGAFIALAAAAMLAAHRIPVIVCAATAVLILIALAAVTWQRNMVWASASTLWADVVRKSPNKVRPYNNLGNALLAEGRTNEAIETLQAGSSMEPQDASAHRNLGTALGKAGLMDKAMEEYGIALRLQPNDFYTFYNLGIAYNEKGMLAEAIECFRKSIALRKDYAEAYNNLGVIYGNQGRFDEAIEQFRSALKYYPEYLDASNNLKLAYGKQGLLDTQKN
jgi:Tfp pilus assembly protein PilF